MPFRRDMPDISVASMELGFVFKLCGFSVQISGRSVSRWAKENPSLGNLSINAPVLGKVQGHG